ncbi:MAG TPA: NADH-quinone oxidoreductase subunit H [Acidimicrobiales bacterium]|nr:NADH-quinone oxidoreductase subunit H [Acidimicrobiales bacterium]
MSAASVAGEAVAGTVQVVALAVGGPVLLGAMRTVRCRLEGRVGPSVFQPLRDIRKLFRKERIRPDQASWVFPLAPVVLVATVAVAGAIAPLVTTTPVLAGGSDLFAIVYLLLTGSALLALAGLDAGTAFGGMGSSRAVTIGALAEPALLVTILALSFGVHSSNLPAIVHGTVVHPGTLATPQRLFALGALVVVIVAESGRLPVDNPATHLELTMVHEAMVLEYAGPDLALVTVGEAMRLALLLGVFVNLVVPWGVGAGDGAVALAVGLIALAAKVLLAGGALAVFEVFTAKVRLFRLPELLAGAFVLALLGVVSGLVVR